MSCKPALVAIAASGFLSGCATLNKSIEQRISVSEQCRLATSLAPADLAANGPLASIQLGNIGVCGINGETILPMCAIDQIVTDYGLSRLPVPTVNTSLPKEFTPALAKLRKAMQDLAAEIMKSELNKDFQDVALTMTTGDVTAREKALGNIGRKAVALQTKLASVRFEQDELRGEIQKLTGLVDTRARAELAAWDENMRVHLNGFGRVLSGDYMLIIQEGVKDQVLTHVARRTLDMLHGSLKAPDAVLRQLDDKAYGAVSIAYLAFGPNLQAAVTNAFGKLDEANQLRQEQADKGVSDNKTDVYRWSQPLKMELRRAACENLVQGTQFSMLTELLDTMIIMHVEKNFPVRVEVRRTLARASALTDNEHPKAVLSFSRSDTILFQSAFDMTLPAAAVSLPPPAVTPAGVHMTHVWTARQQLLVGAISAKLRAAPTGGVDGRLAYQEIETVDESVVQRLADAATAKTIDDAVRLDPAMLGQLPGDVSPQLKSSVNVVTAATAVSSAAVTMRVNLSVSNVNTFNPTNYNNITPVINLPAAPLALAPPSLCAAGGFGRADVLCTRDGDAVLISLARPAFRADSCSASDLEPGLTAIGRGIADYRARYGVEYLATIEGYASLPKARLAKCRQVARAPATACSYVNHLRTPIDVTDCGERPGDANLALSAARARNAARVLELAGRGAVTVNTLVADGARTAALRGEAPAADQTVLIRLQPRPGK